MQDIGFMFHPRSIAVVGASAAPLSLTNIYFLYPLLNLGYEGRIYPVNPRASEIMRLKAYPSLKDIPEPVDNVVCALPAPMTPKLMQECVEAGVKVVVIFSAGFGETGDREGVRLEREILKIARQGGVRVVGPNCLGLHCPEAGLSLDGSISRESGDVSFLSQSGGNARDLILAAAERQIYFRKLVSYGNAVDLNEADFIEHFAHDSGTATIAAYIEGIRQPRRFLRVLREAAAAKPVIVLKGGTTQAGTEAVASHTGALAGSRNTWDSLCQQAGAMQVHDIEELIDTIEAFTYLKPPGGRRIGIIGMGGGANVVAADQCERAGLVVPVFPRQLRQDLLRFTPPVGVGLRNPLDTATGIYLDPPSLAKTIEVIGGWDGIDILFVSLPVVIALKVGLPTYSHEIDAVIEAGKSIDRPVVIVLRTAGLSENEKVVWEMQGQFFKAGFPVYRSYLQAAQAVSRFISYHQKRGHHDSRPESRTSFPSEVHRYRGRAQRR